MGPGDRWRVAVNQGRARRTGIKIIEHIISLARKPVKLTGRLNRFPGEHIIHTSLEQIMGLIRRMTIPAER